MQSLRLGFNFYNPDRIYPPDTLFVEIIYTNPQAGNAKQHWADVANRADVLRNAGHRLLLRVSYSEGQDQPTTARQSVYYTSIDSIIRIEALQGHLVTFGNEPNLVGNNCDNIWFANLCSIASTKWRAVDSRAKILVTPFAAYSPVDVEFRDNKIEDSPWSRRFTQFLALSSKNHTQYDGYCLHAYGLGPASEPWADTRSAQGWRFGTNILETWMECITQFPIHKPSTEPIIIVSEYNTRARGIPSSETYQHGALQNAMLYTARAVPKASDLCWFVDRNPGGWDGDSLADGKGNLGKALADAYAIMSWTK